MSIQIPVTVELKDEAQLSKIIEMVDGDAPPASKVDAFVNELIDQVIAGAMVLPPSAVDKLLEISPELDDADKIVEAVEAGAGVSDGELVIRWPIDPALTQPLRDRAMTNGVTVQQLIRDMMDNATALGYFYDLSGDMRVIFLSREDEREATELLKNHDFTSSDIMEALRTLVPKAAAQSESEEEDPFEHADEQVPASVTE